MRSLRRSQHVFGRRCFGHFCPRIAPPNKATRTMRTTEGEKLQNRADEGEEERRSSTSFPFSPLLQAAIRSSSSSLSRMASLVKERSGDVKIKA
ncbi:hypothetical protein MUK42_26453 [Musa troglodytarum]|uniref:Uncharacterized protein n=1 Tax=Musa troglodytarum TaxID=320322 RepID=A0A9E7ICU3_9LILI|nr:hypothetical protein MUK42_26453 [Musa troglodytarum]